jgi:hypothetical protein
MIGIEVYRRPIASFRVKNISELVYDNVKILQKNELHLRQILEENF